MRAGTENLYGIIGLAKALEIAYSELEETKKYITSLRDHLRNRLKNEFPDVIFNSPENGLYTVLNVNFPASEKMNYYYSINTMEEVDFMVDKLKEIVLVEQKV